MAKSKNNQDTELEDNLFGGFEFINKPVPKKVNKEEPKAEDPKEDSEIEKARLEAEKKTLEEIERVRKEKESKVKKEDTEDSEEEVEEDKAEDNKKEDIIPEEDPTEALQFFAKELADRGILDIEDPTIIKSDDDLYDQIRKTVQNGIEGYKSSKDREVQEFLDFVDNGGNPRDFHKYYYDSEVTFEEFEMKTDEDREYIIREGLALEEYSQEEIEEEINDLKDLGKLEKKSEILLKKLQKFEKDQRKLLIDSQKENAKKEEERRSKEWAEFKKGLFEKDKISGFKFTDKMKNDTWDYMTKIVNKKEGLTQYQIDSASNTDSRYIFAYLLKNKWDIKALEEQVTTKAVSKLAAKLNNYTDNRSKIKSGKPVPEREKDDTGSFSAFKTIL